MQRGSRCEPPLSHEPSLADAKKQHLKFVAAVESGKYDERKKKISFERLVEKYLEYQKHHKRSWKGDEDLTNKLKAFFKGKTLDEIVPLTVESYRKKRLNGKLVFKKKQGVKPATVNRETACLKTMFRLAEDWGYIKTNFMRRVKQYPEPLEDVKPLTQEQEIILLDAWRQIPEAKHAARILEIALYSGMRLSEVRLLEKDRVDLKAKFPSIYVHRTKSGKPKRIIMNETLTEILKEAIKDSPKDSKYVFVNPKTGKPYTSIKTTFKKAVKRAGLENFKFHHTRHSFASRMLESGVPEVTIMELGGWKTRNMINRYAHPSDAHKHEAMKTLDLSRTNSRTTFLREKEKASNSL